jgi:hypothetical protein
MQLNRMIQIADEWGGESYCRLPEVEGLEDSEILRLVAGLTVHNGGGAGPLMTLTPVPESEVPELQRRGCCQ